MLYIVLPVICRLERNTSLNAEMRLWKVNERSHFMKCFCSCVMTDQHGDRTTDPKNVSATHVAKELPRRPIGSITTSRK